MFSVLDDEFSSDFGITEEEMDNVIYPILDNVPHVAVSSFINLRPSLNRLRHRVIPFRAARATLQNAFRRQNEAFFEPVPLKGDAPVFRAGGNKTAA